MRLITVIAVLAAALALAAGGQAGTVQVGTTFSGAAQGGVVGSASVFYTFSGRATIASVGVVSFKGSYESFCSQPGPVYPPPCGRDLVLTLTSPSGDVLTLSGSNSWLNGDSVPAGTWTVDTAASTGRFAGYSGSGGYSTNNDDNPFAFTGTIALSGTLTK